MSKFKVGDKVKYIKHSSYYPEDKYHFRIGNIYTIKQINGSILLQHTRCHVTEDQIELWNPCEEALQGILNE